MRRFRIYDTINCIHDLWSSLVIALVVSNSVTRIKWIGYFFRQGIVGPRNDDQLWYNNNGVVLSRFEFLGKGVSIESSFNPDCQPGYLLLFSGFGFILFYLQTYTKTRLMVPKLSLNQFFESNADIKTGCERSCSLSGALPVLHGYRIHSSDNIGFCFLNPDQYHRFVMDKIEDEKLTKIFSYFIWT